MYFRYNESKFLVYEFDKLLTSTVILLICHFLFGTMLTKQNPKRFSGFGIRFFAVTQNDNYVLHFHQPVPNGNLGIYKSA